jgi:hypothetical protein
MFRNLYVAVLGHLSSMIAGQQVSHDRLVDRMERVEKRLELQTT